MGVWVIQAAVRNRPKADISTYFLVYTSVPIFDVCVCHKMHGWDWILQRNIVSLLGRVPLLPHNNCPCKHFIVSFKLYFYKNTHHFTHISNHWPTLKNQTINSQSIGEHSWWWGNWWEIFHCPRPKVSNKAWSYFQSGPTFSVTMMVETAFKAMYPIVLHQLFWAAESDKC